MEGIMVDLLDHVLIIFLSFESNAFSTFSKSDLSENGPFLIDLANFHSPLLI
jgi:hypothetical protein